MNASPNKRGRGFRQTGKLLETRIRKAGEERGFAVTRLLTHWAEIAGPDIAAQCRPVQVGYGRQGLGATLTILTTGSFAPLLQAQLPRLRDRVNTCYGYNAISRIRITQTAPSGFAEDKTPFEAAGPVAPKPEHQHRAAQDTRQIDNADLRAALAQLGANVLSRTSS